MATGFKIILDPEILAEAQEAERQEQDARDKVAAEKARLHAELQAKQKAEEDVRQAKLHAEAAAQVAMETERQAKERAAKEAYERADADKRAKEQAAETAQLAKQHVEDEAIRRANEELAKIEEAKRQELAAKLKKQTAPKEKKKPTVTHPAIAPVTNSPQEMLFPAKSSPWGGKAFLPTASPQLAAVSKPISTDVFKAATPPPSAETPAATTNPVPKKPCVLGAAFTKGPDGSA